MARASTLDTQDANRLGSGLGGVFGSTGRNASRGLDVLCKRVEIAGHPQRTCHQSLQDGIPGVGNVAAEGGA